MSTDPTITDVRAVAYEFPTDAPESDGTLEWSSTTLVVVTATAGGITGLGYTYAHQAAATLVDNKLVDVVNGRDAFDVRGSNAAMTHQVRNLGAAGVTSMAISAV